MSNAALNWAFALPITGPRKAVLLVLANHADEHGDCFPSQERIATHAGVTDRCVRTAMAELQKLGLVDVTATGRSRNYHLNLDAEVADTGTTCRYPEPSIPERGSGHTGTSFRSHRNVVPEHRNVVPTNPQEPSRTIIEPPYPYSPQPEIAEGKAKPSPLVNGQAKGFETWWQAYPRKEAKGAAAKAYAKALTLTDPQALLDALDRNWPTRKYIPHPATWLNSQRWLDEIETGDSVLRAVMEASRRQSIFPPPDEPTPRLRIVQ